MGYPAWLIKRSENEVGNFLKTFCLLLRPSGKSAKKKSLSEWLESIEKYRGSSLVEIAEFIEIEIGHLPVDERLVLLKILTGTFKSPVSIKCVINGLSLLLGQKPETLFLRYHACEHSAKISTEILQKPIQDEDLLQPSRFCQILSIDDFEDVFSDVIEIEVFGKREGIETQLVICGSQIHLWTKEGVLITNQFPEITEQVGTMSKNLILNGQIVSLDKNLSFEPLHSRLKKKSITKRDIHICPVEFEYWELIKGDQSVLAELHHIKEVHKLDCSTKEELADFHKKCRALGFEGLLIKSSIGPDYYFWKASAYAINVILMNVEIGGLENEGIKSITLGVRHNKELIPVSKITDFNCEIDFVELSQFVKESTVERFGPVRTVSAKYVYEVQFDGISRSNRRKSGVILNDPKITKRIGTEPKLANSLAYLHGLL